MSAKLMNEAMACTTQSEADAVLARIIDEVCDMNPRMSTDAADYAARQRIGYYAGNVNPVARERVERLFRTAHPIYGAIRYNGPPTPRQKYQLGIEYGQATRDISVYSSKHRDALTAVAAILRVDARRVPCDRPAGIKTRALDAAGAYSDCDIATLTCDSLIQHLRSRGGRNVFAESIVLQILGHELPAHMILTPRPSNSKYS